MRCAAVLAILLLVPGLFGQERPARSGATDEEREVVLEIQRIRSHPKEYAAYLRALGRYFTGTLWRLPNRVPLRTQEGAAALDEAVRFLETVTPISTPMTFSEGLHRAARDHVLDQGPTGLLGHGGTDGTSFVQRASRHGLRGALMGEVINYGPETPRMTILQLVIDDGVEGRGHRKTLFNPDFRTAGAAIGFHRDYDAMTVVDLADSFAPPAPAPAPASASPPR
jgi:uncharacterized protein YkwD